MSKSIILFLIFMLTAYHSYSQLGQNSNFGTKSLSLGGISTTLGGGDAIFNNFANITASDSLSALVSSERRFELEELTSVSLGIQLPISKLGNVGVSVFSYGLDEFKEQKFSLLYARKISKNISMSLNFDYNNLTIQQFGNKGFISFGIGSSGGLGNGYSYGIYLFSPEKIEIAEATEVPGYMKMGVKKTFSSNLNLYTDIVKVIDEDLNVILGFEYNPIKAISLRIGYNTNPGAFAFGLAYQGLPNITIEGGTQYNTILGVTPGVSVKYHKN